MIIEDDNKKLKQLYARAVRGSSKKTDAVTLQTMEEVEITEGDFKIDFSNPYPFIQFNEEAHEKIYNTMQRSAIVRLLGGTVGYKMLLMIESSCCGNRKKTSSLAVTEILTASKPFYNRLTNYKAPWTIYVSYLTVQPWSKKFSKSESHPSKVIVWVRFPRLPYICYSKALFRHIMGVTEKVIKIDYNAHADKREQLARLTVMVNLNKPLIPCLKIDGFIQKLEEGLQKSCFRCSVYAHAKESHGLDTCSTRTEQDKADNTKSAKMASPRKEDLMFGPLMVALNKRRIMEGRTKNLNRNAFKALNKDPQTKETNDEVRTNLEDGKDSGTYAWGKYSEIT
ncbi:hypothetical protein F3Y22_tig00110890pilonHSYRG00760 [Hibiscus syriacus]|uniref:Uncharacterized protein n=1 Tax=Hibiscus syriacus TaxID=106335 RepID=A0A6A2ZHX6_HIBSY|nr:hypothetical protein F3Y22_tig00110890pilonHSYRG00760 [Hibiscus syriacus]